MRRFAMIALAAFACGGDPSARVPARTEDASADALPQERPVTIGSDGYFRLHGKKTIVIGVEDERDVLTDKDVDTLIPRLKEAGVNFVIVYLQDLQSDHFYQRMEAEGLWVAQHLGTLKKETQGGFSNTGGVIGTVPDEAWFQTRAADIERVVPRLAAYRNILFWWMGGEFVEPDLHGSLAAGVVRDHVARYRDLIRQKDPLRRPFTVSHHYVEAIEDPALPFIDYADLTDFTWFTVATHFHLGDFTSGGGWWPVAQISEAPVLLEGALERAVQLNHGRPIFFGGWYGQSPLVGPCTLGDQRQRALDKWAAISSVPNVGFSTYHLDEWSGNGLPHALFVRTPGGWTPTPAGVALREIALSIGQ